MPIYEYRCRRCGHTLEVIQKFSDPPRRKCPECSGRLERLVSRTAFILKGGGWYADDYTKKPKSEDKKSDSKSESKSAKTSSSENSSARET